MDNKFDRIIREPLVMGGQGRIRDTNITVNEIVHLSLQGTSQAVILAKFPELEDEDIYQALVYGIEQHQYAARAFSLDFKQPIEVIHTCLELIDHDLNDDVIDRELLLESSSDGIRAIIRMSHKVDWFRNLYNDYEEPPMAANEGKLKIYLWPKPTNIEELPSVRLRSTYELNMAIQILRNSSFDILDEDGILSVTQHGEQVIFQVERQAAANLMSYISPSYNSPYTTFDLAKLLLRNNNSELIVRQDGDNVIFEFSLPIWKDEQD